jgi:hypothetical protein
MAEGPIAVIAAPDSGTTKPFGRPVAPNEIDYGRLQSWLYHCKKSHAKICARRHPDEGIFLNVIDCHV